MQGAAKALACTGTTELHWRWIEHPRVFLVEQPVQHLFRAEAGQLVAGDRIRQMIDAIPGVVVAFALRLRVVFR